VSPGTAMRTTPANKILAFCNVLEAISSQAWM
jgi:hypothetical protein